MINIRSVQPEDLKILLGLFRELAEFEKLTHEMKVDENRLQSSLFGARKSAEAVLVENDGVAIGYAVYFHNFSTFLGKPGLYLEDIYVRPEFRSKGVGKSVFKHLAQVAIERGCERMEWVVLDWNQKAIDFYDKLGAKQLSDWVVCRLGVNGIRKLGES